MKKITLLWPSTSTSPSGTSPRCSSSTTARVCRPFLTSLGRYPGVRASLHFSGVLLSYFKDHQADVIEQIAELVGRDQVELLGGGFSTSRSWG